jgi:glycosyltransferase involved in cell wall biosynthesis
MNILYIEHYAGSPYYGMEYRPYYLSREWVKQGHNVTILAASYGHLRQHQPKVEKDFQVEVIDGINYVWFKTPQYGGSIARIRNIMTFMWKLKCNEKKIADLYKPDVVIASSTYTTDNIPAHRIAKYANAKYVYELHDIWPLSPMLIGGYSKYHPFIMVMQWGENYAYRNADKVVSLLWNAEEHCEEYGLADGKFVCVPNGYNPEEWTDGAFHQEIPSEHSKFFADLTDKTIVGFAGSLSPSGALMTFVQTANELKSRKDIQFVLVGKGQDEPVLRKYVNDNNLENVTFLSAVPKNIVPSIISHFDIAYYGGIHSVLHKYGTSANKMTDYMLSSKPIVQAIDEPGSMVEKVNCGLRVEAENPQAAAEAIIKLSDKTNQERATMGERGKEYAINNLQWSILAKKFLDSLE